jgi:hypothetical protein
MQVLFSDLEAFREPHRQQSFFATRPASNKTPKANKKAYVAHVEPAKAKSARKATAPRKRLEAAKLAPRSYPELALVRTSRSREETGTGNLGGRTGGGEPADQ